MIIVPCLPLSEHIKDGTQLTIDHAAEIQKPYLIISLADKQGAIDVIQNWISEHDIKVLNIEGLRESSCLGIGAETCELFREFL